MANGTNLSTSRSGPVVDFTSSDFEAIKEDVQSYAQATFAGSGWTDFNVTQPAVMFVDILAYIGDLLTYQLNSHIRELFAASVLRRQNLISIGKPFGYEPAGAVSATVVMRFTLDPVGAYPFTLLKTHQVSNAADGDAQVIYQPIADTVVGVYPGAGYVDVTCVEGELFSSQLIGVSGNAPSQRWQFPQQSVVRESISLTVGGITWTPITNWTSTQSSSQVYKIVQTDDGNTYAVFGDGVYGSIPAASAEIRATFRVGGGRRGNLTTDVITRKLSVPIQVLSVTNPDKASGGDDAPSMKVAREGIPATISTLERAVNVADHATLAKQVSGVAKARAAPGVPAGSNRVRVWIAPSGGGVPTPALKNDTTTYLRTKKMVGKRISTLDPVYKNLRFQVLLHINENFRAADVSAVTRAGITNTLGTGLLDFAQLDFAGVSTSTDGNEELLMGQTSLQGYFDDLRSVGLERAEILQFDVEPVARARDVGNTGDGSLSSITLTGRQRRREFVVQLVSSAQYRVYERIIGRVSSMTNGSITDDEKDFLLEGVTSYTGYLISPNREISTTATISSVSSQEIAVSGLGGVSLFTLTEVGNEYFIYNPTVLSYNLGATFTSSDGNVSFTVTAGATPFLSGDEFTLDTYPHISDIRLRNDEYPQLTEANFITRTAGGSRV